MATYKKQSEKLRRIQDSIENAQRDIARRRKRLRELIREESDLILEMNDHVPFGDSENL